MNTRSLAIIFSVAWQMAYTQYFNHDYGSGGNDERNNSGLITLMNPYGYLMGGTESSTIAAIPPASVVSYNDTAGFPNWINDYWITCPNGAPAPMVMLSTEVAEGGFNILAAAGAAWDPAAPIGQEAHIYFMHIDGGGNLVVPQLYNSLGYENFNVEKIIHSSLNNDYYITGYAFHPPMEYRIFILRVDINGVLQWGNIYDSDPSTISKEVGFDIEEDPSGNLVVAGMSNYFTGTEDGIMLWVTSGGTPINMEFYGSGEDDAFTAIQRSQDAPTNFGYVLAGYSYMANIGARNGWMMRIDQTPNILWSYTYDYNITDMNDFWDVKERPHNDFFLQSAQYFACGRVGPGIFGNGDIIVEKVDVNGLPLGRFTYGSPAGTDDGVALDITMNTNFVPGLSVFGHTTTGGVGNVDMTMYKTYFNGVTACKYDTALNTPTQGPVLLGSVIPDSVGVITPIPATPWLQFPLTDQQICYRYTIPEGDNSRMLEDGLPSMEIAWSNDAEQNGGIVLVENAFAGNTNFKLTDVLGNIIWEEEIILNEGANRIPVQLDQYIIASGLYLINITQGKMTRTIKIGLIR